MKNIITLILCLVLSVSPRLVKAQNCHAGTISALKDTICQGLPVTLKVTGSSGNIQWQEATGDTFVIIAGAVDSTYRTVPLTQTTYFRVVVSNGGCSDTSSVLRIFVPVPLIGEFSALSDLDTLKFNSDSSKGSILRYHWDFGDGDTSSVANPLHIYDSDTTYYICLTEYDSFDCSNTFCRYISVNQTFCSTTFAFSHSGDAVYFKTSEISYLTFYWNFGDGTTSEDLDPVHVYDSSGIYHACLYTFLSLHSSLICEDSVCHDVSVVINAIQPVSANQQTLTVYPNPCTDCEIKGLQNPDELLVTDLLGRAIPVSFIKESNSYRLSFSSNGAGMYLIKNVRTGEVVKFVKE